MEAGVGSGAVPAFSGVVLAGGRSLRMGRDKAELPCDGQPLWSRQRQVLEAAGAREVWLAARAEQPWTAAATGFAGRLDDVFPDAGPMAGIHAALVAARASHVAVLGVDLAGMEAGWFRRLAAGLCPGVGVVGRRADGWEPLAAFFPCEAAGELAAELARGQRSLQRWLARAVPAGRMQEVAIPAADVVRFGNWNCPADVASTPSR